MSIDVEALKARSGIYQILHAESGRSYIGQSVNLAKRLMEHRASLRRGAHDNRYLQRAFDKYGEDQFSFSVVEYSSPSRLTEREQFWIDRVGFDRLFNLSPSAGRSQQGVKRSLETRQRISSSKRGTKVSEHTKRLLSQHFRGIKMPPRSKEWCIRISNAKKGKPFSQKALRRAAEVNATREFSLETRKKISDAKRAYWAKRRAND